MLFHENKTYSNQTNNNKPKRKYPISKPSYLISESSNIILQSIEAKMKANKQKPPTPQLYSIKTIDKPQSNNRIKQTTKARSHKLLPKSMTTNASPKAAPVTKAIITVSKPVLYSKVNFSKLSKMNKASNEGKGKLASTNSYFLKENVRKNLKLHHINSTYNNTHYDSNRLMTTSGSNFTYAYTYANSNTITSPNSNSKNKSKSRSKCDGNNNTSAAEKVTKCKTPNSKIKTNIISSPNSTIRKQRNSLNVTENQHPANSNTIPSKKTDNKLFKPYPMTKFKSNSPENNNSNKNKKQIIVSKKLHSPVMSSKFKDYHGFNLFNKKKRYKTRKHLHANSEILYKDKSNLSSVSNNSFNTLQNSCLVSPKSKVKITNASNNHSRVYYENNIAFTSPNTLTFSSNTLQPNSISKRVSKIDFYSKAGLSSTGIEKVNQDNYFITQNFLNEGGQYLFGVCDGHGVSGHFASEFIVNHLPETLLDVFSDEKPSINNTHTKIQKAFAKLNTDLIQDNNIDSRYSGSTCISAIISKEKIICSNLGDSRAVLALYEKGSWNAVDLSRDHTALVSSERNRIIQKGGRIASYVDEYTHENLGPERVWLQEADLPGLAMTRSFGDQIAHCVGVTCNPEIRDYYYNGTEKFIVAASDGLWQYIDSSECVYFIKDYYLKGDVSGACYAIVEEAFNRWLSKKEAVDDITVIIAFLK